LKGRRQRPRRIRLVLLWGLAGFLLGALVAGLVVYQLAHDTVSERVVTGAVVRLNATESAVAIEPDNPAAGRSFVLSAELEGREFLTPGNRVRLRIISAEGVQALVVEVRDLPD